MTGNAKLCAECIQSTQTIANLNNGWSPEVQESAFEIAAQSGNLQLLETLLRPPVNKQIGEDYEQALTKLL
jgi:hypothetical protein